MRPRDAPVRPAMSPVGVIPLRSGPGSGILLGTSGTGDRVGSVAPVQADSTAVLWGEWDG